MTYSARFSWTVLLPVKVLARAKSRLAVLAGDRRGDLALALASDTVSAVLACPEVARVVVVTSDPVAGPLLAALGAIVVADEPADLADRDRSTASGRAARSTVPTAPAPATLACKTCSTRRCGTAPRWRRDAGRGPGSRRSRPTCPRSAPPSWPRRCARRARGTARAAFVPDAAGVGTTLYAVPPGGEFLPLFGGASRARHAAAGAAELGLAGLTGLRRDVDTPDDLREALALGVGPFTRAVAADLFTDV